MSKSQQVSKLRIRKDIHDMEKRIQRKLAHIRNELSADNIKLIEEYYNAMKLETCGKVVQDKHLQCILKMTLILDKYWKDATKSDIERVVLWIIDRYVDIKGQETHASSDYKKVLKIFVRWVNSKQISYVHPELAEFARKVMLSVFAIILITAINVHVQAFELFDEDVEILESEASDILTHREVFAKLLSSLNLFSIGYAVSQLIPILITKYDRTKQERTDFDSWKMMTGFADDDPNFFHKIFEWVPPKHPPKNMSNETFQKLLKTKDGRKSLEQHRTTRGLPLEVTSS